MSLSRLNAALIAPCKAARVIPVLTVTDVRQAVPLAQALLAGGLKVLEVTLRTPSALDAIRQIARDVPDALIGAGTILTPQQAEQAIAAGARFLVSPGATPALLDAAANWSVPLLPGIATASEAMAALERGIRFAKFFPAETVGGVSALKALAAPLADMVFCPTGGVSLKNVQAYLGCPNVVCVGGSWVAPQKMVDDHDWQGITTITRDTSQSLAAL